MYCLNIQMRLHVHTVFILSLHIFEIQECVSKELRVTLQYTTNCLLSSRYGNNEFTTEDAELVTRTNRNR